jgi:tetratricopeptide (TPR) repeat protein
MQLGRTWTFATYWQPRVVTIMLQFQICNSHFTFESLYWEGNILIPPRPIILWGRILADKGEYQKALGHIQKAMSVREALLGNNHTDTAISYATMASVLLRSKKKGYHEATLKYSNLALNIFRQITWEATCVV